jgi:DNA-binding transcriptional LysR family regulator
VAGAASWDDLQHFLAVCRHSTIGGAARALGVNHSTVLRRLASLEDALGQRCSIACRRDMC